MVVEFKETVTVDNAEGFRLTGGAARISRLLSGNRSSRLVFQLTDYVLPDDQFKLLHWSELSDARLANQKLASFEDVVVTNALSDYQGNGKLYYVLSSQGNDGNLGLSKNEPLRTIARAQAIAGAGDFILLKRGDRWSTRVIITNSGQPGRYITYAAYNRGAKPIVHSMLIGKDKLRGRQVEMATVAIRGADYIQIDNIHVKTDGKGTARTKDDGIQIGDGAKYAVVSNCTVEGIKSQGYWGIRVTVDGLPNTTRPEVYNCEVFNYYANMGTQIWPHDGKHGIEEGGLIENCISRDPITPNNEVGFSWENIMINRGDFHGFVIRKNKVYNYVASGIETFASKNVIVEYNEIYDPLNTNIGGKGIKAGGYNSAAQTAPGVGEIYSEDIIIRYNKVYNIIRGNTKNVNAIDASGARSGEIYGNLVYNVKGIGIKIAGQSNSTGWEIYNNTVLDCGEDAIQVYSSGPHAANVRIKNNILEGKLNDINIMLNGGPGKVAGQNNLLLNGKARGSYAGKSDSKPNMGALFVDRSKYNYQLKPNSYALNKGVSIEGFYKGIDGNPTVKAPDIGAYQFAQEELSPSPAPQPIPSPTPEPSPSPSPEPAPSPSPAPAPQPSPSPSPNANQGLHYRYYHGSWHELPDFSGMEAVKSGTVADFSLEPRTQQDDYGFLYEGYIQIKQAGKYTFYTKSDDGSKLWINEQLLVDNDGLHALQERLGAVYLTEGYHPIRVTFFDRKYADGLQVSYEATGIAKQTIPGEVLFTKAPQPEPIASVSGLHYRYYHGSWHELPDFSGMEAVKSGTVADFSLEPRTQQDDYGFLYEGYIQIKQAGKYTFYTKSDDGSKLWINEQLLVDNDGLHALQERLGAVYLTEGYHPIRVTFFDRKYADGLQVSYEATGIAKQTIPGEVLFTKAPQPEPIASVSGLHYRYYHGSWHELPDFSGMEAVKSGTVADFSLEPRTQQDDYGFLYEGYIQIKQAGKYTFYTKSDDGSKLWINEQLLVDNDGLHALQERLGAVYLTEGYHPIRVTFFDRKYADGLQVSYEATGIAKQTIPGEVLFTNVPNQPAELIATTQIVRADAGGDRKLSSDTENVALHGQGHGPYPFRSYLWEKVSGPDVRATGQNTANVYLHKPAVGIYVFRFTAVDSEGNQGSDEIRLEVSNQTARSTYQASKLGNELSTTDVKHKIYVYPNPTKDVINLATTSGESRLPFRIYNQQGQLVHEGEVKPQAKRASIKLFEKYFKSGIYVLKVYSQQLGTQTFRLLKE